MTIRYPKTPKILLWIIVIIILLTLGWIVYYYWKNTKKPQTSPTLSPGSEIMSPSPTISLLFSPSPSPSPTISPTTSPTQNLDIYQVPEGETYEISSIADTNGDAKDETLVVTKKSNGKYHAYVLSSDGAKLYDNPGFNQKPIRIATQKYDMADNYLSWMLVFTEQSGNLAFVHWNGTEYEIPQEDLGI